MPRLEVLGGARYNSLQADLNFKGPLAVHVHGEKSWWDPFVGGRLNLPLGEKSSISARLDLGVGRFQDRRECRTVVQQADREASNPKRGLEVLLR